MVRRRREDYRVSLKQRGSVPLCGETEEEHFARVNRSDALKKGIPIPMTVFVRRKDFVIKELPTFYDDMLFTYDGARIERVLNGINWASVRGQVRSFALEGITCALESDAKTLSLLPGQVCHDDESVSFGDDDVVDSQSDMIQPGWLDAVREKVCVPFLLVI